MDAFKKEFMVNVSGVVFVICLTIFYGFQYQNHSQKNSTSNIKSSLNPSQNLIQTSVTLSLAEVQKHNSVNDCWVIISNNVYNVTSYINLHPGGATRIDSYCGQDMTQAFLSRPHSSLADQQHANMLLGPLNGQVSLQKIQIPQNNLNQPRDNFLRRGGEDD